MKFRRFRKIWKPEVYQGQAVMKGYFEGWYYKLADRATEYVCAVIPGVSFDSEGKDLHCFIQFHDNTGNLSSYHRYPIDEFSYDQDKLEIRIGSNIFYLHGMDIDMEDDNNSIKGVLDFHEITPWPVKIFSPGAMGWYAFVPFMECYHGVLSFNQRIQGHLSINGQSFDFTDGKGYIEKDWGRSFPKYHIWLQTNHFTNQGTSLMVSIANIPWMGNYFDGFLIGLLHDEKVYRFATYSSAKIEKFVYDGRVLTIQVKSKKYTLEIEVSETSGNELRAPVIGEMGGRLSESLSALTEVRLFKDTGRSRELILCDHGIHTGLEIQGDIPAKLKL